MDNSQNISFMQCPFCLSHSMEPKSGQSNCPECSAEFEIDDRLECVFVNPMNLKLPVNWRVCVSCGLVQGYKKKEMCILRYSAEQHGAII
jgi:hypothetical protein